SARCRALTWPQGGLHAPGDQRAVPHRTRRMSTMTTIPSSRRDVLKGTAAVAAATALGSLTRRAHAQGGGSIDSVLRQATDAKEIPGVVAMAATAKGLAYEGAFGVRALDGNAAMTLDTVFRIASMTKAITSTAAMQLVEQGKLKLEE